jgi:hypothetical protein
MESPWGNSNSKVSACSGYKNTLILLERMMWNISMQLIWKSQTWKHFQRWKYNFGFGDYCTLDMTFQYKWNIRYSISPSITNNAWGTSMNCVTILKNKQEYIFQINLFFPEVSTVKDTQQWNQLCKCKEPNNLQ